MGIFWLYGSGSTGLYGSGGIGLMRWAERWLEIGDLAQYQTAQAAWIAPEVQQAGGGREAYMYGSGSTGLMKEEGEVE